MERKGKATERSKLEKGNSEIFRISGKAMQHVGVGMALAWNQNHSLASKSTLPSCMTRYPDFSVAMQDVPPTHRHRSGKTCLCPGRFNLSTIPSQTLFRLLKINEQTGKDLRLPADLMQRVFHQYKLFNAKSFMAGLNKIVDEIGEQMADPFKVNLASICTKSTTEHALTARN